MGKGKLFDSMWEPLRNQKIRQMMVAFLKVNSFHILMETLITVYLLVIIAIFSDFILKKGWESDASIIVDFVVIPFCWMILVAVLAAMGMFIFYVPHVNRYLSDFLKRDTVTFVECVKRYRLEVIISGIMGTVCYCLFLHVIAIIFAQKYNSIIVDTGSFMKWIIITGTALGAIWNITACFRNQRMNWAELVEKFQNNRKETALVNRNCYFGNLFGVVVSVVVVVILVIATLLHLNNEIKENASSLITDYNFVLVLFFTLTSYYLRKTYKNLFATKKKKTEYIFLSINKIVSLEEDSGND